MALPIVCQHCGVLFQSNIIGGPERGFASVSVSQSVTDCPACGKITSMDGNYAVAKDFTVVFSAPWLADLENRLRRHGISKSQAKRIQRKITKSKDVHLLPDAVRQISPQVADAVEQVINQPASETDKWQWIYRIAAMVGIIAGVNTFSKDYNIDAAIKWVKSHLAESSDKPSHAVSQNESVKQTDENGPRGPM